MEVTRQAVILVGGRGTRLGELTNDIPKPLLAVAGRPFLEYVIDSLIRQGFDDILLLAGYRADVVVQFASDIAEDRSGISVRAVVEDRPLGTGGALRHAKAWLADQFVLMNGDTLFDINLNDLLMPPLGTMLVRMALRRVPDTARFGRVVLTDSAVKAMEEKGISGNGLINGGIYFLSKACVENLPPGASSVECDLFPGLISEGLMEAREYAGFFLDIGIPSDFLAAQTLVPSSRQRPAVFFDRDGVLNEDENYVFMPEQFRWIEGAKDAVKFCNEAGYYVFVVTNQAGVARGYYDVNRVNSLHAWMQQELRAAGAHVDQYYFCPHHPDFTGPCDCRKPEPGMIIRANKEWPLVKERSFLIGDNVWDVEAAVRAEIVGYLFHGTNLLDFLGSIHLLGNGQQS